MHSIKVLMASLFIMFFLASCSSGRIIHMKFFSNGVIGTDGVVIRAEDGAFEWRSGVAFIPPSNLQAGVSFGPVTTDVGTFCKHEVAAGKCINVRIKYPGYEDVFYGILLLSKVDELAVGPGTRSYYIQVPENYVRQATDGRISVVYEKVELPEGDTTTTWILWLSDMPIKY